MSSTPAAGAAATGTGVVALAATLPVVVLGTVVGTTPVFVLLAGVTVVLTTAVVTAVLVAVLAEPVGSPTVETVATAALATPLAVGDPLSLVVTDPALPAVAAAWPQAANASTAANPALARSQFRLE